jgi:thiol-disulfide isomerase/thioredoxin
MAGCEACAEYHPIFEKVAAPYAAQGLPIVRLDAESTDPNDQKFMTSHGVEATPCVVVATLYRGALDKRDGVLTEIETRYLLDAARVAAARPPVW